MPAQLSGDEKNWLILRKRGRRRCSSPPGAYRPMAATPTKQLPRGEGWLFEPKWDGYRALAYVRGGEVELQSRRENDLTTRFDRVASTMPEGASHAGLRPRRRDLPPRREWAGELLGHAAGRGHARLLRLRRARAGRRAARRPATRPSAASGSAKLVDRRSQSVVLTETFDDGEALLDAAAAARPRGGDGEARGLTATSSVARVHWLKVKVRPRQELVVAGYTKGQGRRERIGALVLGIWEHGRLRWAGNVGTGFTDDDDRRAARPPDAARAPRLPVRETRPKMPRVRAERRRLGRARARRRGRVRRMDARGQASLPDVPRPTRRQAARTKSAARSPSRPRSRKGKRTLKLSNLDKVFWPEEGITKGDLLAYYREVAPVLVPHLRKRPFTMKRYPDGIEGKMFFQKDAPSHMPDWIATRPFEVSTRESPRTAAA